MNAYVSWRAVLQQIDESEMAEGDSISTAVGKNNSWLLLGNKELGLYTNLLGNFLMTFTGELQSNRLMLGR